MNTIKVEIFKKCGRIANKHSVKIWISLYLFFFFSIQSCAPKIDAVEPPIEQAEAFSLSGTENISEKWWTAFEDPILDTLVKISLKNNLDLSGNWHQFQAALAVVRGEESFFLPEIEASARTTRSRPESDFSNNENFQFGASASYEVDLWGRIRSGIQAEEFRAEATFQDYLAAAMTLSAETSINWYQLVTARKQLELANQQIKTNEDIMRLIRARFVGGEIRAVDILRQEQLLESTRAEKIFYETEIELLKNRLSILLGKPPQNKLNVPGEFLPDLPPLPETGLPLELVRRRPDVQQAYNLVLAADRDMAEAITTKYPRISIEVAGQMRSNNYNSLFKDWAYTVAGNIVAPLFYGGRIRAEVDRTEAVKNQLLYNYGQTVLIAFQEVEDALVREQKQKEQIQLLEQRLELARKTNNQLRNEFLNGMTAYLDVLLSLDQEQQLQRNLLEAEQILLEIRIELYRALAGGFSTERTEAP